ncbi:MAG: T9SS type A sorting domain-containing protein, partial [Crocinitomicaceae bacterium]|nr:T9SS type A sorting domain-containing protein [Crocinitomicaceae bacterium]
ANWAPGTVDMQNTSLGLSMIHGLDNSTAWAVGYPNGAGQTGGIWKTTDGGGNWTRQNSATYNNAASFTNVVYFWNANEGFCQGDPINGEFELYTTTDGGTNWTVVPGGNIPNPENGDEFGYVRQIEVVGDNVWYTTSTGRMYHSTDKGYNWVVYNTPVPDFGGAINSSSSGRFSFSSATDGLIIDNNGIVYKTTNSGANWSTVTTSGPIYTEGLCFIEGTTTAFSTGGGSSYSQDGGSTWSLIDTEQHLYVEFLDLNVGWSGWFNIDDTTNGMWKWEELPADAGLGVIDITNFTLYPNPTSGELHVSGDQKLIGKHYVVRNIIGQILADGTLMDASTAIETESFVRGAYFFTIVEGNATKKFIKN